VNELRPTPMRGIVLLCSILGVWLAVVRAQRPATGPADLALINGKILTVDSTDAVAQAVAVTNGTIVAVGSTEQIRPRIGTQTRVIDLRGRTATPGLIDSHVHFSEAATMYTIDLGDGTVTRMADVLQRVADRVKTAKPGEWVQGRGWDEGKLAERRYVTAADLDKVSPDNPVWLTHTTGHYGVANSAALRLAGVERDTKDPPAGTIDRNSAGTPTGVLKESAQQLVTPKIPPLTREQQKNGILKMIEDFNREGMTGAKDPGIAQAKWDLYQEILKEGKLTVRMFALWAGGRSVEATQQLMGRIVNLPHPPATIGDGRLISGGVKMYMDGSGGARTAWMYQDWNKNSTERDTGNTGYPTTPPDEYRESVRLMHNAGLHVSTHAIGDRAIDWVVDTYERALAAKPTRGLRHGIIHANIPSDHALEVMARLQRDYDAGYPEAQATFLWWIGDTYTANLGPERSGRLKPFRTYLQKGIRWAGGSDYGVTPFPARYSLWSSVARTTLNGTYGAQPFGTRESVDIRAALRAQTIWAAHQLFLDDRIGSIEVGKDADIAVWDQDMYTAPTDQLKDLKCVLTLFRGAIVYRDMANQSLAIR
jgi:predicted amidohydrolase YtcJ